MTGIYNPYIVPFNCNGYISILNAHSFRFLKSVFRYGSIEAVPWWPNAFEITVPLTPCSSITLVKWCLNKWEPRRSFSFIRRQAASKILLRTIPLIVFRVTPLNGRCREIKRCGSFTGGRSFSM